MPNNTKKVFQTGIVMKCDLADLILKMKSNQLNHKTSSIKVQDELSLPEPDTHLIGAV